MLSFEALPVRAITGAVTVPGDKSISHRSMMLAGICDGMSEITGFLPSADCLASLRAMQSLGVRIRQDNETHVYVHGVGMHQLKPAAGALDMGNAGTAIRLFTGLLSGQRFDSRLIGDASLSRRPMERVAKPLREMGANILTSNGTAPIDIRGAATLHGIEYRMPVASAQVKSALLLAGLYASGTTSIIEPAISRDHSERMLKAMGVHIEDSALTVRLTPPSSLVAQQIRVPGDFSSAAFFLVAGLIGADHQGLQICNVGLNPTRIGLMDILNSMGAQIEVINSRLAGTEPVADLFVRRSELRGVSVPAALVPLAIDEFPVLFIAAACAKGETLITGAQELRVKESDRISVMSTGLSSLGVDHEVFEDGMRIWGRPDAAAFSGGSVDSHGDHRIAMSFAIASLRSAGAIRILDVANVDTSFPRFEQSARLVGLQLSIV